MESLLNARLGLADTMRGGDGPTSPPTRCVTNCELMRDLLMNKRPEEELCETICIGCDMLNKFQIEHDNGIFNVDCDDLCEEEFGGGEWSNVGKVRHLATGDLWIQQRVHQKRLEIEKLPGEVNPSDAMTKGLDRVRLDKLMGLIGIRTPQQTTAPILDGVQKPSP